MYFKQLEIGPMKNFIYCFGEAASDATIVVDPAWEPELILNTLKKDNRKISAIFLTHLHYDHSNGLYDLLKNKNIPVYVQQEEINFVNKFKMGGLFTELPEKNAVAINRDREITIGSINIRTIFTPGHSPGSQCFLFNNILLTGDTLFIGSCGRHDIPGGDPGKLKESLKKIAVGLPDNVTAYPGHNYAQKASNILGNEKKSNPFLKI